MVIICVIMFFIMSIRFAGLLLKLRRNISEGVTQLISDFDWASISAISCQDVSVGSNWSASHLGDEEVLYLWNYFCDVRKAVYMCVCSCSILG